MQPIDASKLTQWQHDVLYSMSMYQTSMNDIATSACLDACELVFADKDLYRREIKRLANKLHDAAKTYDHCATAPLSDENKCFYADYFDAWQDVTSSPLTRLRMCVKNDIDRRREPLSNVVSSAIIAVSLADLARRVAAKTAEMIHKECPTMRVKQQWYIGEVLRRYCHELIAKLSPKYADDYLPSEATQAALKDVERILLSSETSERIEMKIREMYKKEEV